MPALQTLQHSTLSQVVEVFNESFSDYIVPLNLTMEQMENKIKNDSIQLAFSAAAFESDKPVAFILHGYDVVNHEKIIYNAGTGVIPSRRGNSLTRKLYDFILPRLHSNEISKIQLEVITENKPAIKTYQNIGFEIVRELNCYKGSVIPVIANNDFQIQYLDNYDWDELQSFWDWKPSWQNSITAVENLKHVNASFGIYTNEILLGYLIFNPATKRVQQFAVHKDHRGAGIGKQLFRCLADSFGNEISIINIDEASVETAEFVKSIGLKSLCEAI
jgi:ribosomal protein S18 acetylase RimI-like enzyme